VIKFVVDGSKEWSITCRNQAQALLTRASKGPRALLSSKYAYNRELQLRRFAEAFPNTALCDLGKEHLEAFVGSLGEFAAKSRNHYRAAIRQFLQSHAPDWQICREIIV
jgi:hypothetical protein